MKLAVRINSFLKNGRTIVEALDEIGSIDGITHVDLNYPEHLDNVAVEEVKQALTRNNLKVNGLALRFREVFSNGELGNSNPALAREARTLCKEAMDLTREFGGSQITIWLGYDGFDYSFQLDYARTWRAVVNALTEIADYDPGLVVSIEYKPYEPRAYSLIPDIGTTLLLIDEVGRENLGVTLDFCHMRMKNENPAYALVLAGERGRLSGVHLNDGYGLIDDGLMVGTVNFMQTMEFLYYMKRYSYDGVIYFDTFPIRESAKEECLTNIRLLNRYISLIEAIGMDEIQNIIDKNSAIAAQEILLKCLR